MNEKLPETQRSTMWNQKENNTEVNHWQTFQGPHPANPPHSKSSFHGSFYLWPGSCKGDGEPPQLISLRPLYFLFLSNTDLLLTMPPQPLLMTNIQYLWTMSLSPYFNSSGSQGLWLSPLPAVFFPCLILLKTKYWRPQHSEPHCCFARQWSCCNSLYHSAHETAKLNSLLHRCMRNTESSWLAITSLIHTHLPSFWIIPSSWQLPPPTVH